MKLDTCALRGIAIGLTPDKNKVSRTTWRLRHLPPEMYCQSKQIESNPRPSLPLEPPKTRVKSAELGLARQKMENPVTKSVSRCHLAFKQLTQGENPLREQLPDKYSAEPFDYHTKR